MRSLKRTLTMIVSALVIAGVGSAALLNVYDTAETRYSPGSKLVVYPSIDTGLDREEALSVQRPSSNLTMSLEPNSSVRFTSRKTDLEIESKRTELVSENVSSVLKKQGGRIVLTVETDENPGHIRLGPSKVVLNER